MTKHFYIKEIGNIKVTKYRRSKRMKIAVNAKKQVSVSIPYFVSYNRGLGFVKEKMPWIIQVQNKLETREEAFLIKHDFTLKFLDKTLVMQPGPISVVRAMQKGNGIIVQYPEQLDLKNPEIQHLLKSTIIEILRMEAKKYLPQRVRELAIGHGFNYTGVAIKNLRSRWGSCSSRDNINLNLHLIRIPKHLIDYVILHELVHTKHRNHSPHFWNALSKVLQSDAKALQKEMRNYHPDIVAVK